MQTGFAMLCAGSIRAKNVKNVILWNLLDVSRNLLSLSTRRLSPSNFYSSINVYLPQSCGGGLTFWAVGYAFAYGGDDLSGDKTFIGNAGFFLIGDDIQYENWFFQFAFACALSSIVAGTIAERTQMKAYLLYSVFLVGFVYPVVRFIAAIYAPYFCKHSEDTATDHFSCTNSAFRSLMLSGQPTAFSLLPLLILFGTVVLLI